MRSRFPGFPPEGMKFLTGLARHNNREWFQPRKPIFDQHVKQPMRDLVESLNGAMKSFAPEYVTDPEKAVYRIYRDTRFSKDKTPYKEHIAASFYRRGTGPHKFGGYYLHVSPKEVGIGGGVYMPDPDVLLAIRGHIAEHHAKLRKVLAASAVRRLFGEIEGDRLSRVPKGFLPDHPAADLLRYKSLFLWTTLDPSIATTPEFFSEIVTRFRAAKPFLDFLAAPASVKSQKIDPRDLFV